MSKEELLQILCDYVYEMEEDAIIPIVEEYLEQGYPAIEAIDLGLIPGMNRVSEAFDDEEYSVTDLLFAADTMYAALDLLKPHVHDVPNNKRKAKVLIAVVQGDSHDIGKNLVKMLMETAGFEMIDLGKDTPNEVVIEAAVRENVQLICMSSLMTTTMENMREVIRLLKEKGIRDHFKIMVGGGAVNERFAQEIGADAYSANATEAVIRAQQLI